MRILVEKGLGLKSGAKSIYIKGDSAALIFQIITDSMNFHREKRYSEFSAQKRFDII